MVVPRGHRRSAAQRRIGDPAVHPVRGGGGARRAHAPGARFDRSADDAARRRRSESSRVSADRRSLLPRALFPRRQRRADARRRPRPPRLRQSGAADTRAPPGGARRWPARRDDLRPAAEHRRQPGRRDPTDHRRSRQASDGRPPRPLDRDARLGSHAAHAARQPGGARRTGRGGFRGRQSRWWQSLWDSSPSRWNAASSAVAPP